MARALRGFVACRRVWAVGDEVPSEVAETIGASGLVEGYPLPEELSEPEANPDGEVAETIVLPDGLNIPDTIDWIGVEDDKAERAEIALASENQAEQPRVSLIAQLKALLAEG